MQLPNVLVYHSSLAAHDDAAYRERPEHSLQMHHRQGVTRVKEATKPSWFSNAKLSFKPSQPFTSTPSCKLSMLYVHCVRQCDTSG